MNQSDIVYSPQDLRYLTWTERATTSGTSGMLLKAREGSGSRAIYYKLSCYDSYRGIYGHESVNELIASRLFTALGIPCVHYRLIHALIVLDNKEQLTWLSASESFRKDGERKMAFDTFFDLYHQDGENPLDFCKRYGWLETIEAMMLGDYLIANRDRHGANIEVLSDAPGYYRLAPFFDNGLSFVFSCYGDLNRIARFDPLDDVAANNYIGSHSLDYNLSFIRKGINILPFTDQTLSHVLIGLDTILSPVHLAKVKEMLCLRWKHWEEVRDGR